jgi:GTP-binding protein HflX
MTSRVATETAYQQPRTLIVGIQAPDNPLKDIKSYYEEFENLVSSSGRKADAKLFIKLRNIDSAYFLTKGKLQEVIDLCAKENIEEVVISEPLTINQERNLSEILNCTVVDRTLLILEIFERGAHSAEGKKQVELARFQYEKARLAGRGIHMSQQGGSIGTRGPGETQKEKETQHLERQMSKLREDLAKLNRVRQTQRKRRLVSGIPIFSLVGYTNAGKSSILNALTKGGVLAENKLFSTLDTATRELYLDGKKKGLISDTVGFIQQLPHHLVEAFKSTLAELEYASLLLHVIDISDSNWQDHIKVVNNVLEELNAHDRPVLYVFNKIDKVPAEKRQALEALLERYQPHVVVSAVTPDGLYSLVDFLNNWSGSH